MKINGLFLILTYLMCLIILHIMLHNKITPLQLLQDIFHFDFDSAPQIQDPVVVPEEQEDSNLQPNFEVQFSHNSDFQENNLAQELESHLDSSIKPLNFFDAYSPSQFAPQSVVRTDASQQESAVDIDLIQNTQFEDPKKIQQELATMKLNAQPSTSSSSKPNTENADHKKSTQSSTVTQSALNLLNVTNLLSVEAYNNYDAGYATF